MIGKNVTLDTDAGEITGTVDSVEATAEGLRLGVGGKLYTLSQVVRVAPVAVAEAQT